MQNALELGGVGNTVVSSGLATYGVGRGPEEQNGDDADTT